MFWIFICIPWIAFSADFLIDLEKKTQSFILETKKINIPGYPDAFNPSIIRWDGQLYLTFRIVPNIEAKFNSCIGIVPLDDDFNPIDDPQLLNLRDPYSSAPSRAEDGRLIQVSNRLYIIFSDNSDPKPTRSGFRVRLCELKKRGKYFTASLPEAFVRFEGETPLKREKNWVPFDYEGVLHFSYSLTPHKVFRPIFGTGSCQTVSTWEGTAPWSWGELRGGTQALLVDGEYLSFFHSSKDMASVHSDGKVTGHYFMGAYTFSPIPPFPITRISPEPIVGSGFYHGPIYKPYWRAVNVVFPCGLLSENGILYVSYGRQDREVWIVKIDKQKLFNSLIKLNN